MRRKKGSCCREGLDGDIIPRDSRNASEGIQGLNSRVYSMPSHLENMRGLRGGFMKDEMTPPDNSNRECPRCSGKGKVRLAPDGYGASLGESVYCGKCAGTGFIPAEEEKEAPTFEQHYEVGFPDASTLAPREDRSLEESNHSKAFVKSMAAHIEAGGTFEEVTPKVRQFQKAYKITHDAVDEMAAYLNRGWPQCCGRMSIQAWIVDFTDDLEEDATAPLKQEVEALKESRANYVKDLEAVKNELESSNSEILRLREELRISEKRRGGECQKCGSWVCPPLTCMACLSNAPEEMRKINEVLTATVDEKDAELSRLKALCEKSEAAFKMIVENSSSMAAINISEEQLTAFQAEKEKKS